jgi:hypothetical protein
VSKFSFIKTSPCTVYLLRSGRMTPHFPVWSENATGMLQFAIWTALASEGMGASLQHYGAYSEEISANVLKEFNLPSTWKNTAMMPFGVSTGEPGNPSRPKKVFGVTRSPQIALAPYQSLAFWNDQSLHRQHCHQPDFLPCASLWCQHPFQFDHLHVWGLHLHRSHHDHSFRT